MPAPLVAPDDEQLAEWGLEAQVGDEPWVRSVQLPTGDGSALTITWDEVAASAYVRWTTSTGTVAELTREAIDTITIERRDDGLVLTVAMMGDGLSGTLTVAVSPTGVQFQDTLLRA